MGYDAYGYSGYGTYGYGGYGSSGYGTYGYGSYGSSGYGTYGYGSYGSSGYGTYGYGGPYRSLPNATPRLSGPGSSAYIARTYSSSYAYENPAGGIYTHTTAHTSAGYINDTSYTFSNGTYKVVRSTSYENFLDKSGPAYGYGGGFGYYSSYGPPAAYDRNAFTQTQTYVGQTDYFDVKDTSVTASTNGYVYTSYTHQTHIAVDGHAVTGSGYAYFLSSTTDPYGYSVYSSHTSTF